MRGIEQADAGTSAAFVMASTPSQMTCNELNALGQRLRAHEAQYLAEPIIDALSALYPTLSPTARRWFDYSGNVEIDSWERIDGLSRIFNDHVLHLESAGDPLAADARAVLNLMRVYAASRYAYRDRQYMNVCMDDRSEASRVRPTRRCQWPDMRTWRHETRGLASTSRDPRNHPRGFIASEATLNRAARRAEQFSHEVAFERIDRHCEEDPPPRLRPLVEPRTANAPPQAVFALAA
ncbi:hypothetical protein C6I20_04055 [Aeromicrobium sp. A1-2]|uniref:hypothetical protein n=1 Tax=Aeromicrobium sp. A1-2 TaxID=2107713 RepID=UPI000E497656|nr:hypothetical protein [Aeromicrobium sp. A1-2]AXT84449.1 hypothetical protein C6I20_04055 [Aeromicrobium sp. A1-2]